MFLHFKGGGGNFFQELHPCLSQSISNAAFLSSKHTLFYDQFTDNRSLQHHQAAFCVKGFPGLISQASELGKQMILIMDNFQELHLIVLRRRAGSCSLSWWLKLCSCCENISLLVQCSFQNKLHCKCSQVFIWQMQDSWMVGMWIEAVGSLVCCNAWVEQMHIPWSCPLIW